MNIDESLHTIRTNNSNNSNNKIKTNDEANKLEEIFEIDQIDKNFNSIKKDSDKEKENHIQKETSKISNKKQNLILSRNVRRFIFFIFLLISIMINMDHGTIPAATSEIKEYFKQGDDVLGLFGSLVFLGNILGIIFY
jgi:hypothetical protein